MSEDLGALQNASAVVRDQLAKDATIIPDLGDCLAARASPSKLQNTRSPRSQPAPSQPLSIASFPTTPKFHFKNVNLLAFQSLFSFIITVSPSQHAYVLAHTDPLQCSHKCHVFHGPSPRDSTRLDLHRPQTVSMGLRRWVCSIYPSVSWESI